MPKTQTSPHVLKLYVYTDIDVVHMYAWVGYRVRSLIVRYEEPIWTVWSQRVVGLRELFLVDWWWDPARFCVTSPFQFFNEIYMNFDVPLSCYSWIVLAYIWVGHGTVFLVYVCLCIIYKHSNTPYLFFCMTDDQTVWNRTKCIQLLFSSILSCSTSLSYLQTTPSFQVRSTLQLSSSNYFKLDKL